LVIEAASGTLVVDDDRLEARPVGLGADDQVVRVVLEIDRRHLTHVGHRAVVRRQFEYLPSRDVTPLKSFDIRADVLGRIACGATPTR
jgi:hypothetical protein